MGESIKIACGTDDGVHLTKDHFGEAKYYLIYTLDGVSDSLKFIEKIENSSTEEEVHGDPKKAASVSGVVKDATVLLACAMGKNIIRMRKKYCPVISRETNIEKALELLNGKYEELVREVQREPGEDRTIIRI